MVGESPLDLLAQQIREADARREAVEEKWNRIPSWRLRRRARLERRVQRRREQERELIALVETVSQTFQRSSLSGDENRPRSSESAGELRKDR